MADMNATPAPALPFAAPYRRLDARAPLRWARLGWQSLWATALPSLAFGLVITLASLCVAGIAWQYGGRWTVLVMLPLFVFVAPVLALGIYSISAQLERGMRPSLRCCLREERGRLGDTMVYSLALLVIALLWMRAGTGVQVFYPSDGREGAAEMLRFLAIGSAVGAVFALLAFAASAFALPMLHDRRTDGMTAVVTSFNAVLNNKPAMAVWAGIIVFALLAGFATGFLGLAVTMPWIGHATWHGYRETIDASAWPANTPAAVLDDPSMP